jgi:hypothetical protein
MKRIYLSILVLVSVSASSQTKFYDSQRIDSLYGKLFSGSSTDSVVVVNSLGKFKMRNASAFGISGITADNGLTASTSTNVQLGGALIQNTTITGSDKDLIVTNTRSGYTYGMQVLAPSSNNRAGLYVTGSDYAIIGEGGTHGIYGKGGAYGILAEATNNGGVGLQAVTIDGQAILAQDNSSVGTGVHSILTLARENASAANGIGIQIDYKIATTTTSTVSNQLISKWTDATTATRTSQFIITGVNSAVTQNLVTIDGDGTSTFLGPSSPTNTVRAINTTGTGVRGESTTGNAINGAASSSGNGGVFSSISGNGLQASSVSSFAAELIKFGSTTNDVLSVAKIRRETAGTAAAGEGGSLDFYLEDASNTILESNKLVSIWTDAANATRTSKFTITGVSSATTQDWLTIGQSGYLQVRPMTVTEAGALTPAEGMIIFVSNTNGTFTSIGLWDYENSAWHKL